MLNLNNQKIHETNDFFARIRFYNKSIEEIEDLTFINYGDLKSASYSLASIFTEDSSVCEISLINEKKFNIIKNKLNESPLLIEIFEHLDYENLKIEQFNPIYFIENISSIVEKSGGFKDVQTFTFTGIFGSEVIAKTTVANDNVKSQTIVIDENGKPIEPPNFNKILFDEIDLNEAISELFRENVNSPNFLTKGIGYGGSLDNERKTLGLVGTRFFYIPEIDINFISEKMDLHSLVKNMYNSCRSKSEIEGYPFQFLKFDYSESGFFGGKYEYNFRVFPSIIFDKTYNSDLIKYQENNYDFSSSVNNVIVESDKVDKSFFNKKRIRPNVWKPKEKIEISAPNEGSEEVPISPSDPKYIAPLGEKCDEILSNGTPINTTEIEMLFKDKKLFIDIIPQQIIELKNFGDLDGKFRVDLISAVVESTYTSYSLEKITKLGGN